MSKIIDEKDLPTPRLELRWRLVDKDDALGVKANCHYSLVLPLREHDIRREDEDGNDVRSEQALEINVTESQGGFWPKYRGDYIETPYRDGVHAIWDSEVLNGMPIYAVCPATKKAMLVEHKDGQRIR